MTNAALPPSPAPPFCAADARRAATRRVFLRLCGAVVGAGVAASVDARFVEPYDLETTHHEVFLPDLPVEMDGVTVAQLTDLHRGPSTPDAIIASALKITADLRPDLVVLTGDFVSSRPSDAAHVARMLGLLTPRFGLWGCLGNHDYHHGPDAVADALTQESGGRIHLLRNAAQKIAPGLWIAGIEDTVRGYPDTAQATAPIPPRSAALFLTHNPVGVWEISDKSWLALAGHTHGGQVRVPGMTAPLPIGMEGFPLIAGWGKFDRAHLYISRGVGMVMPAVRFRCRPEVAFFVLRRGNEPPHTRRLI